VVLKALAFFSAYWITNDPRCRGEIKCVNAMAQAAFYMKSALFTSKVGLNLSKKPVKCCIWSIVFFGTENWAFRKVDYSHFGYELPSKTPY
jgi:hypothetical protein